MSYPSIWSIEIVRGCNLRCPICAVGCGKSLRPLRHMSLAEYETIAAKIAPHARQVALHVWGEPTLNRDLMPIIMRTLEFAPASGIHTNANRIRPEDMAPLAASAATISVSIDGMTQATYARYRQGGDLAVAIKTLRDLVRLRRAAGQKAPIGAQFLEFKHNTHEIPEFLRLCRELGIPGTVKTPQVKMNPVLEPMRSRPPFSLDAMLACPDPTTCGTVLADGTMVVCCYDFDAQVPYGNIISQPLAEVWGGPAHQAVLKAFAERKPPEFCLKNCYTFG